MNFSQETASETLLPALLFSGHGWHKEDVQGVLDCQGTCVTIADAERHLSKNCLTTLFLSRSHVMCAKCLTLGYAEKVATRFRISRPGLGWKSHLIYLHSQTWTWHQAGGPKDEGFIFQPQCFRCYVSFRVTNSTRLSLNPFGHPWKHFISAPSTSNFTGGAFPSASNFFAFQFFLCRRSSMWCNQPTQPIMCFKNSPLYSILPPQKKKTRSRFYVFSSPSGNGSSCTIKK